MAMEPITYQLSAPAQAHGETITELTLRPVKGEDIAACGYPFTITNMMEMSEADPEKPIDPRIEFNGPALIAMISRLAGVPRSTVASLSGGDVWAIGFRMAFQLFFPSTPATSSSGASTSPGSGDSPPPPSLVSISRS